MSGNRLVIRQWRMLPETTGLGEAVCYFNVCRPGGCDPHTVAVAMVPRSTRITRAWRVAPGEDTVPLLLELLPFALTDLAMTVARERFPLSGT